MIEKIFENEDLFIIKEGTPDGSEIVKSLSMFLYGNDENVSIPDTIERIVVHGKDVIYRGIMCDGEFGWEKTDRIQNICSIRKAYTKGIVFFVCKRTVIGYHIDTFKQYEGEYPKELSQHVVLDCTIQRFINSVIGKNILVIKGGEDSTFLYYNHFAHHIGCHEAYDTLKINGCITDDGLLDIDSEKLIKCLNGDDRAGWISYKMNEFSSRMEKCEQKVRLS
jgi:hypothetical protein